MSHSLGTKSYSFEKFKKKIVFDAIFRTKRDIKLEITQYPFFRKYLEYLLKERERIKKEGKVKLKYLGTENSLPMWTIEILDKNWSRYLKKWKRGFFIDIKNEYFFFSSSQVLEDVVKNLERRGLLGN